jgi:AcrR family transcriptional regulator
MQAIADDAGVNKALLHYYFRSKQNLYEAILKDVIEKFWSTVRETVPLLQQNTAIDDLVHAMVSSIITVIRANPDFIRIILREFADGGKYLPALIDHELQALGAFPRQVFQVIHAGIADKKIRPVNPVQIMISVIGMAMATFVMKPLISPVYTNILHQEFIDNDAFYTERIEVITDILCRGILINRQEI